MKKEKTKNKLKKEEKIKKVSTNSRVWHIVRVITKYNAVLKLNPEKLKLMLEELGPTYVKLGQLMSSRADIIPLEYCKALEGLRSDVKPMPFEDVKRILESEWKCNIDAVCKEISPEPIGSASIAQVHKAILTNGEEVVIKVQRENIYEIMQKDIKLLKKASKLLKLSAKLGNLMDYDGLFDEMWRVAKEEMDFKCEAENIKLFMKNNANVKYIKVPAVYEKLSTSKVLVMEQIHGYKISELENLKNNEYDFKEIANKLCENYIKQVIDDGFYHADPHAGNIMIEDGKIVWIDMGMMGRLSERNRDLFKLAVNAVINNDASTLKDICLAIGDVYGEIDHFKLNQDINMLLNRYGNLSLENIDVTSIFTEFSTIASSNNIKIPKDMTMFGRGLVSIEGVIESLDSSISLIEVVKNYFAKSFFKNLKKMTAKDEIARDVAVWLGKTMEIPKLLNEYLKSWAKGQTRLNAEVGLNNKTLTTTYSLITKATLSLLVCFLILGGSICTLSDKLKYFWGLPIVSWVMFIIAFILLIVLVVPRIKKFFKRFK